MKAKDLALQYKSGEKTVTEIFQMLVKETRELAHKSDSALAAILRETEDKWKAFTRLCPDVDPNGFKRVLHTVIPSSKELLP